MGCDDQGDRGPFIRDNKVFQAQADPSLITTKPHAYGCEAADFGSLDCTCVGRVAKRSDGSTAPAPPRSVIIARINALKADRFKYLEYLDLKIRERDWHGVEDCGSDLRDVEAAIAALEWVTGAGADGV